MIARRKFILTVRKVHLKFLIHIMKKERLAKLTFAGHSEVKMSRR